MHNLRETLRFSTTNRLFTQSVGWSTLHSTPEFTFESNICFNRSFMECGVRRADFNTGVQPPLRVMWYFPRVFRPRNTSL